MQTDSSQASARAVFTGKYGKTTGKYGGLRAGEIGVNNANDWRGGVVLCANSDGRTRKNAADERTPPTNGSAVAFVEQSRSLDLDGERTRTREMESARARAGPPADALDAKTELAALANALQVRCIRAVSNCISCIR